jgi:alpha-beta hydrolase superfamily lysophospholipase
MGNQNVFCIQEFCGGKNLMKNNTWNWNTDDGLEMYGQAWSPEKSAQAVVCLVHGLGEHSGWYAHVGAAFSKAGIVLSAFDLRGHGKSGGQRGHFPSFDAVMQDIHKHITLTREKYSGLPHFLYGHSLGGLLVLNYATYYKHTLSGVITTGAGLRSPVLEQKAKITLSKILGGLLPKMTIPTGLDSNSISRDRNVVSAYQQDPMVHDLATLSAARVGFTAVDRAFAHASEFPVPLLLMHGTADKITYPRGSQEYADLVKVECTLKFWEGLYHEIHNEPEQAEVLKFTVNWIKARIKKK